MVLNLSLKQLVIRSALEGISFLRLEKLFTSASGRGVIFTLHHVRPKSNLAFNPNAHLEVTPEFLEQAILAAKEAGLEPVRLEDLPALLAEKGSTRKFVCFTLDDGYRNNAEFAAPVFRKHGVPYTIFICPGFVTRARTVWWETCAELLRRVNSFKFDFGGGEETIACASRAEKMAAFERLAELVNTLDENEAVARIDALSLACGFDPMSYVDREIMNEAELRKLVTDPLVSLSGHTLTHCNLARVPQQRLEAEIAESSKLVSGYAGRSVRTFSYPYGWKSAAGSREFEAAANAGLAAVTTQPSVLSAASNPAALPRVSLNGLYQKKRYVRALISGVAFKLM
jgi:peptidoglycan/xylan/chitin deacetylase (PgdA/CDA1 family)